MYATLYCYICPPMQKTEAKYNMTIKNLDSQLIQKSQKLQVISLNSVYMILIRLYTYLPMQETESTVRELAKKLQVIIYEQLHLCFH